MTSSACVFEMRVAEAPGFSHRCSEHSTCRPLLQFRNMTATILTEKASLNSYDRNTTTPTICPDFLIDCYTSKDDEDSMESWVEDLERRLRREKATNTARFIETNWKPEHFSEPRPLRDFHATVPADDRSVQVCIRDHECEDGDRVRVTVNGRTIFNGEIVNQSVCESVPVSAGNNRIELHATNGSGNKGPCDYRDANSGQITVTARGSQRQTWKHRGGSGSSARIVVTVE